MDDREWLERQLLQTQAKADHVRDALVFALAVMARRDPDLIDEIENLASDLNHPLSESPELRAFAGVVGRVRAYQARLEEVRRGKGG